MRLHARVLPSTRHRIRIGSRPVAHVMRLRHKHDGPRAGLTTPVPREGARPEPGEADLSDVRDPGKGTSAPAAGPGPKPEVEERKLPDPKLSDLSFADWKAVVIRAGKEFMNDNAMMLASALAYSSFFAIP